MGFTSFTAYALRRESNNPRRFAYFWLRWSNSFQQLGNINPMSIDYAFRPCLRIRLTPGGRTCPGKPWNYGVGDSHPDFRYSCPHNHFRTVHSCFHNCFDPVRNAPLPSVLRRIRSFGNGFDSRSFSARDHSTSQLLRTV